MPHELSQYAAELPPITDFLAGDDRVLAFSVVDADGNTVDIADATVSWSLHERPYESDSSTAVLSGSDSDVEVVTDDRVNSADGDFEIRLDPSATDDLWGNYHQRPVIEQSDGTTASWVGKIVITA